MFDLGDEVRDASIRRLCERGILVETEGRVLWFLKTRRYPVTAGREIREVKLRPEKTANLPQNSCYSHVKTVKSFDICAIFALMAQHSHE
jgi:hypothetical protein